MADDDVDDPTAQALAQIAGLCDDDEHPQEPVVAPSPPVLAAFPTAHIGQHPPAPSFSGAEPTTTEEVVEMVTEPDHVDDPTPSTTAADSAQQPAVATAAGPPMSTLTYEYGGDGYNYYKDASNLWFAQDDAGYWYYQKPNGEFEMYQATATTTPAVQPPEPEPTQHQQPTQQPELLLPIPESANVSQGSGSTETPKDPISASQPPPTMSADSTTAVPPELPNQPPQEPIDNPTDVISTNGGSSWIFDSTPTVAEPEPLSSAVSEQQVVPQIQDDGDAVTKSADGETTSSAAEVDASAAAATDGAEEPERQQPAVIAIAIDGHAQYPLDEHGRPVLPANEKGEKVFPLGADGYPLFPFDRTSNKPCFPIGDDGQPVFPIVKGKPMVPTDDSTGQPVFPVGADLQPIFPLGPHGKPVAPMVKSGKAVLPLDASGKAIVPYNAEGEPLIHVAGDGITPLDDYYNSAQLQQSQFTAAQWQQYQQYYAYQQYYSQQYYPQQQQMYQMQQRPAQHAYVGWDSLKVNKKVRPEDIDLPTGPAPPKVYNPTRPLGNLQSRFNTSTTHSGATGAISTTSPSAGRTPSGAPTTHQYHQEQQSPHTPGMPTSTIGNLIEQAKMKTMHSSDSAGSGLDDSGKAKAMTRSKLLQQLKAGQRGYPKGGSPESGRVEPEGPRLPPPTMSEGGGGRYQSGDDKEDAGDKEERGGRPDEKRSSTSPKRSRSPRRGRRRRRSSEGSKSRSRSASGSRSRSRERFNDRGGRGDRSGPVYSNRRRWGGTEGDYGMQRGRGGRGRYWRGYQRGGGGGYGGYGGAYGRNNSREYYDGGRDYYDRRQRGSGRYDRRDRSRSRSRRRSHSGSRSSSRSRSGSESPRKRVDDTAKSVEVETKKEDEQPRKDTKDRPSSAIEEAGSKVIGPVEPPPSKFDRDVSDPELDEEAAEESPEEKSPPPPTHVPVNSVNDQSLEWPRQLMLDTITVPILQYSCRPSEQETFATLKRKFDAGGGARNAIKLFHMAESARMMAEAAKKSLETSGAPKPVPPPMVTASGGVQPPTAPSPTSDVKWKPMTAPEPKVKALKAAKEKAPKKKKPTDAELEQLRDKALLSMEAAKRLLDEVKRREEEVEKSDDEELESKEQPAPDSDDEKEEMRKHKEKHVKRKKRKEKKKPSRSTSKSKKKKLKRESSDESSDEEEESAAEEDDSSGDESDKRRRRHSKKKPKKATSSSSKKAKKSKEKKKRKSKHHKKPKHRVSDNDEEEEEEDNENESEEGSKRMSMSSDSKPQPSSAAAAVNISSDEGEIHDSADDNQRSPPAPTSTVPKRHEIFLPSDDNPILRTRHVLYEDVPPAVETTAVKERSKKKKRKKDKSRERDSSKGHDKWSRYDDEDEVGDASPEESRRLTAGGDKFSPSLLDLDNATTKTKELIAQLEAGSDDPKIKVLLDQLKMAYDDPMKNGGGGKGRRRSDSRKRTKSPPTSSDTRHKVYINPHKVAKMGREFKE